MRERIASTAAAGVLAAALLWGADAASAQPGFTLTAPTTNQSAQGTVIIQWSGGDPAWTVDIELIDVATNAVVAVVASGIPNSGSHKWTFPASVPCPKKYRFYLEEAAGQDWVHGPTFGLKCAQVGAGCPGSIVPLTFGASDGFAGPPPPDPNPQNIAGGLQAWVTQYDAGLGSNPGHDVVTVDGSPLNDQIVHRFQLPAGVAQIHSGNIRIRLRSTSSGGMSSSGNDTASLRFFDANGTIMPVHWSRRIGPGGGDPGLQSTVWGSAGQPGPPFQFDGDLSQLPLANGSTVDLLPEILAQGFVDLHVQDDTAVDFARLRLCVSP